MGEGPREGVGRIGASSVRTRVKVLVGDPGTTTGWVASVLERTDEPSHEMVKRCAPVGGHIGGGTSMKDELANAWDFLSLGWKMDVDVVVLESFILFPDRQHTPDPSAVTPVRIISMVEAYNDVIRRGMMDSMDDALPIIYQTPSQKSVITDERLRRWGLWTPGKTHKNDAMRHLLVFARKWLDV